MLPTLLSNYCFQKCADPLNFVKSKHMFKQQIANNTKLTKKGLSRRFVLFVFHLESLQPAQGRPRDL